MDSYAPAVESRSVTYDYLSRVYDRISGLLSNLKMGADSYLSKFWYHVNIVSRLDVFEGRIEEAKTDLSNRVGTLNQRLSVISKTVEKCEGYMVTLHEISRIQQEIIDSQNVGERLKEKKPVLEHLLSTLPKK